MARKAACLLAILALSIAIAGIPTAKGKQLYYFEIPGVIGAVFELPEGWKCEPMRPKEVQKPHHYVVFESGSARISMYPSLPYASAREWSLSYATGIEGASRECLKVGNYEVYSLSYKTYSVVRSDYTPWAWGGKSWYGSYIGSWGFGTDISDAYRFHTISKKHNFFFFKEDSRFWLLEGFSQKDAMHIITTLRPAFKAELESNARIGVRVDEERVDPPATLYLTPFKDHEFEVPEIIPEGPNARLVFLEWKIGNNVERSGKVTLNVSSSLSLRAIYKRQFMLEVSTDHGQIEGSGWYNEGSWAKVSLTATIVGGPLIRYRFSHWAGDASGSDPTISVRMDGPKVIRAIWVEDYANLYALIAILAIVAGVMALALVRRRRSAIQSPPVENALGNGAKAYEEKLERLSNLFMRGKISEGTYESLKAEYEERIKRFRKDGTETSSLAK
ncbi:MAG: hypothetical protein QXY42_04265 [Candidatus Bathyarchaeia archaeon]